MDRLLEIPNNLISQMIKTFKKMHNIFQYILRLGNKTDWKDYINYYYYDYYYTYSL